MEMVLFAGGAPDQPIDWFMLDQERVSRSGRYTSLYDISHHEIPFTTLTLVLPGEPMGCRHLNIPSRNEHHLRQAAAIALEDDFAESTDNLHIAVFEGTGKDEIIITAVPDASLTVWLTALESLQLKADMITADFLLLGNTDKEAKILMDDERVVASIGHTRFSTEKKFALYLLPFLLKETEYTSAEIFAYDSSASFENIPITILSERSEFLDIFVRTLISGDRFNLLQGKYKNHENMDSYFLLAKRTAVLACLCCVVWIVIAFSEGMKYKSAGDRLNTEISIKYQELFPDEKVRNLPVQVRSKLTEYVPSKNNFLKIADLLSSLINQYKTISINRLIYETDGSVTIDIEFDFESLERLKKDLNTLGVLTQEGRSPRLLEGNLYSGKLILRVA